MTRLRWAKATTQKLGIGCNASVESGPDMLNRHPLDHPLVLFQPSRIHGIGGFAWVDLRKGQRIIE